jgi:hypothetical protein
MQNIQSSYGRKGIRVSDRCPTRAIRHHLGRVNVSTSVEDVLTEVRAEIQSQIAKGVEADAWTLKLINDTLRFAEWQHLENRAEYAVVMGASL